MTAPKKPDATSPAEKPVAAKPPAAKSATSSGAKAGAAANAKKDGKGAKVDALAPSFMARFQAWWHGYEPGSAAPLAAPAHPSAADHDPAENETASAGNGAQVAADVRMRIAQMAWTSGFVVPGGVELALDLAKPLGLDSGSTMVEIGSGLGGGARAIAKTLGTYVTGFDLDPEVAAEAMIQASVESLEEKAKVSPLNPKKLGLRKDFFRAALVRETLYRVEDKEPLLGGLLSAVKKDCPIVIFDLFAGAAAPSKALTDWISLEPHPIHLCSVEQIVAFLKENHVEVRVEQDDTELYCSMALRSWGGFVERLEGTKITKDLVIPLVQEVERWARRIAVLQSGDLKVWRLAGFKHVPVK